MSYILPENEVCAIVNEALWEVFVEAYKDKYNFGPSARMWTEESVVQWFDRVMFTDKLIDYVD
jgi:hypothetical protein